MKCLVLYTTDIKELDKFNDIDILILHDKYPKNFNIDKLNNYVNDRKSISKIYNTSNHIQLIKNTVNINPIQMTESDYKLLKSYASSSSNYKYEIKIIDFDLHSISDFSDDKIKEYYNLDKLDRYKIEILNETIYSDNIKKLFIENEKLKSEITMLQQNNNNINTNFNYKKYSLLCNELHISDLIIAPIEFKVSEIESDKTIIIIDKDSFSIKYVDICNENENKIYDNEKLINNCIQYNYNKINAEIEKYIKNLKEKINNASNILEIKIPEKLYIDIVCDGNDEDNFKHEKDIDYKKDEINIDYNIEI